MLIMVHKPPSELQEQIAVVRTLRRSRILFTAVPNGGYRLAREERNMKASGVRRGVPDLLIFDTPPGLAEYRGLALEMKRVGETACSVSKEQRKWLAELRQRGWLTMVAFGADHAIEQMKKLGYELKGV